MTTVAGGNVAGGASAQIASAVKTSKDNNTQVQAITSVQNLPSYVKTAGSVFKGAGQFGGLTHGANPLKQRAVMNNVIALQNGQSGAQAAQGSQGAQAGIATGGIKHTGKTERFSGPNPNANIPIGNMLAGNFGGLTMGADRASGNMRQEREFDMDQDMTKTSDQMLEEANNLTMKDMWAAA